MYALTISRDNCVASRVISGAIRMPPIAASWVEKIQAYRLDWSGSAPVRPASDRSSTVARICVPIRVLRSRNRSATATAIATIIVITWCQVIKAGPRRMDAEPEKKAGRVRETFGFQIHCAIAMRPESMATVTTSFSVSPRAETGRMMTRSNARPNSGAAISSTTTRATGTGHPQPTVSCQYANAASMPAAPWAKLNTPVVV